MALWRQANSGLDGLGELLSGQLLLSELATSTALKLTTGTDDKTFSAQLGMWNVPPCRRQCVTKACQKRKERTPVSEKEMSDRVFPRFGTTCEQFERKYAAREVPIKVQEAQYDVKRDCRLDLVAYDKQKRTFKIVELKSGCSDAAIREAFVQLARYRDELEVRAYSFLDAFTRKSPMRFGRLMEATSGGKQISVEFHVGLTDEACKNVDRLRSWKNKCPDIGIIRVKKDDGRLKDYIKEADGEKNYELAKARPVHFVLTCPPAANDLDDGAPTLGAVVENELRPVLR